MPVNPAESPRGLTRSESEPAIRPVLRRRNVESISNSSSGSFFERENLENPQVRGHQEAGSPSPSSRESQKRVQIAERVASRSQARAAPLKRPSHPLPSPPLPVQPGFVKKRRMTAPSHPRPHQAGPIEMMAKLGKRTKDLFRRTEKKETAS